MDPNEKKDTSACTLLAHPNGWLASFKSTHMASNLNSCCAGRFPQLSHWFWQCPSRLLSCICTLWLWSSDISANASKELAVIANIFVLQSANNMTTLIKAAERRGEIEKKQNATLNLAIESRWLQSRPYEAGTFFVVAASLLIGAGLLSHFFS